MSAATLITGADVVDGTGSPRYRADVLIEDGRITAITRVPSAGPSGDPDTDPSNEPSANPSGDPVTSGERTGEDGGAHAAAPRPQPPEVRRIDAAGLVLAPGFIDMHSHADLRILIEREHPSRITQGFTTEVLGQDGLSYAPISDAVLPEMRAKIAGWNGAPEGFDWDWRSVEEYLARLDRGIATNAAYLVPHGNLRAMVAGWGDDPLTEAQLESMCALLDEALAQGAVGLSTGLTYTPAMYADARELERLCAVVARHGGYFCPHTRSYGKGALEAYREVIDVALATGCSLDLTHATLNFAPGEGAAPAFLALVDDAIARGCDLTLDSYPYLAGSTTLAAILPSWASAGGVEATLERLGEASQRARIREALEVTGSDGCHGVTADWTTIEISGVGDPALADAVGRTIAELARERGREPFDVFVDLLVADRLATGILQHVGHEENVRAIMRHTAHLVSSDGLLTGAKPHPRSWGTATRYLGHYVRELGILSLEEMIHHMTGRAARRLRLRDRGFVRVGDAADLVLLDPRTVGAGATFEEPRRPSTGIRWVLVNGETALADGRPTGALAGRALRMRGGATG